jgi:hypothetical protein
MNVPIKMSNEIIGVMILPTKSDEKDVGNAYKFLAITDLPEFKPIEDLHTYLNLKGSLMPDEVIAQLPLCATATLFKPKKKLN